jgi:hypothetical protein
MAVAALGIYINIFSSEQKPQPSQIPAFHSQAKRAMAVTATFTACVHIFTVNQVLYHIVMLLFQGADQRSLFVDTR